MDKTNQQISQIEKSVTNLLVATKSLLETLTQWSKNGASDEDVSDVYVRLGYEFNLACRAFNAIGVDTSDLGPVPELLRAILEETLSQDEQNQQNLERFLPRIRDIIINLLQGLKKKQQKLRGQSKDGRPGSGPGSGSVPGRQTSQMSAVNGQSAGITEMLQNVPAQVDYSDTRSRRTDSDSTVLADNTAMPPPRTSSTAHARNPSQTQLANSPTRGSPRRSTQRQIQPSDSSSSLSSNAMQNIPVLPPYHEQTARQRVGSPASSASAYPPPPPPPKEDDALTKLQEGGDLGRRASKRYSAYQISKHTGLSMSSVPMPAVQNGPVPNRGRDGRESMNAVRARSSYQKPNARAAEPSPSRGNQVPLRISEERSDLGVTPDFKPPAEHYGGDSPTIKTPDDKYPDMFDHTQGEAPSATMTGPPSDIPMLNIDEDSDDTKTTRAAPVELPAQEVAGHATAPISQGPTSSAHVFTPEPTPPPEKELTLFLQYKSRVKKFVLPEGYQDLTIARLQLAFIEKFAWNTHNNGVELPEIYVQDPVSGVRHELEDLSDVKDRSVLALNVEVLDEVKKHIDDGLGSLRQVLEGVRSSVESHDTALQRVADRQQDAVKEIGKISLTPRVLQGRHIPSDSVRSISSASPVDLTNQASEMSSLRRELAIIRQSVSGYGGDFTNQYAALASKFSEIKDAAITAAVPTGKDESGRAYLNGAKATIAETSDKLVSKVDDLQDTVEELRRDVVSRGVRPLPRQLEEVTKDISHANKELLRMQESLKREKPIWTKIQEQELQQVCQDREDLQLQEDMASDLEGDLKEVTDILALVEQATKQQNLQNGHAGATGLRSVSRTIDNENIDPMKAKDGVLGEVRALQVNHDSRLEAIARAEKARQKELASRSEGEFGKELGAFVEEGKLKKTGGVEEAERLRKLKDEKNRKDAMEFQAERERKRMEREREQMEAMMQAQQEGGGDQQPGEDNGAADGEFGHSHTLETGEANAEGTITGEENHQPANGNDNTSSDGANSDGSTVKANSNPKSQSPEVADGDGEHPDSFF